MHRYPCWLAAVAAIGCERGQSPPPEEPELIELSLRAACAEPPAPGGSITFPDTVAGAQTSFRPLLATNEGPLDLRERDRIQWTIEGPDAAEFEIDPRSLYFPGSFADHRNCEFRVPIHHDDLLIGQECRVPVMFRPATAGPKQATLRARADGVGFNVPARVDQTFSLAGTAVAAPAGLHAATPDLYIDPVTGGDARIFRIVNGGTTAVDLGDPVVTAPFKLGPSFWRSALAPGEGSDVYLGTEPDQSGCQTGSLTTTTSAISVPLLGPETAL